MMVMILIWSGLCSGTRLLIQHLNCYTNLSGAEGGRVHVLADVLYC